MTIRIQLDHPDKKYVFIIFSVNPFSKYSFFRVDRSSIDRIDDPIEQPIHDKSLGLKLHEAKPS